ADGVPAGDGDTYGRQEMLRFALLGAGRIGRMHADNLAALPNAELGCVFDVYEPAAREVAEKHGAKMAGDVEEALSNDIDAVLIASSTDTHVDLIAAAARAGKAVLCEKPIDLDIDRVDNCQQEIAGFGVPVQIGFNRRYDPTHKAVRDAAAGGEIGDIHQVIISSRDPDLAPMAYLKVSGGLYRDMMIHDFDMARYVMGEDPVELSAIGSVLVESELKSIEDVDTAMVMMRTASGIQCHINCSRRAVYGYDQRLEVFGSKGMLRSDNRRPTNLERYTETATAAREPLTHFFIDRYPEAYVAELSDFIDAVTSGREPSVTFEDGRRALILADAANESLRTGRTVQVSY
ncbi:MAG: inositol 2-dehydrogenase, partial [Alphaproteobacteria bacterium]